MLIAVTQWIGLWAVVGFVVLSSNILGIGWPHLLKVPARRTLATVIAATGIISAGITAVAGPQLQYVIPVIALGVISIFLVQLFRGSGRPHRLQSLLGAAAATYLAAMASGWISLAHVDRPEIAYIAATAGIFSSVMVGRGAGPMRILVGIILGLAAGLGVTWLLNVDWLLGAAIVTVTVAAMALMQVLVQNSASLPSNRSLMAAAFSVLCIFGAVLYYLPILVEENFRSLLIT